MGAKVEKTREAYSVRLKVSRLVETYTEDSYDKTTATLNRVSEEIISLDISGPEWEALKKKLHAHIDLA